MKYTTLFLDRDGTINKKPPAGGYIKSVSEVHFLPGVLEAMPILYEVFRHIIVTTNQRGVSLGVLTTENIHEIHTYIESRLGFRLIDKFYFCPHQTGLCNCRKPQPGMALQAKRDFPAINFVDSIVAGDSLTDLHFAHNIGGTGFLIDEDFTLLDFAKWIRSLS